MMSFLCRGGRRHERKKTDMFDVFGLEWMFTVKHDGICYIEKHMWSNSGMSMMSFLCPGGRGRERKKRTCLTFLAWRG